MQRSPLASGQVLNQRYRIERLLGQGGFGAVYLAWDLNLDGPVALKESFEGQEDAGGATRDPDTQQAAQSSLRQFQLEAKILFQLRHPNLPRVSDYFSTPGPNGGAYLVMDYIEGEDLQAMLDRAGGPLPFERSFAWIVQVCDALQYLHTQPRPIIHRDIKPANIRVTHNTSNPLGQAILVDFGIAKLYDASIQTTAGARAVTLNYSPPEQYGLGKTDAQSDVYALGATAYHVFTGKTPAPAVDVMSGTTPPPVAAHQLNPQIPPGISAAIEKAMQLNRAARWQSAAEFAQALRENAAPSAAAGVLTNRPILVQPTPYIIAPQESGGPAAQNERDLRTGGPTSPPPVDSSPVTLLPSTPIQENAPQPSPGRLKSFFKDRRRWLTGCAALLVVIVCGCLILGWANSRRINNSPLRETPKARKTSIPIETVPLPTQTEIGQIEPSQSSEPSQPTESPRTGGVIGSEPITAENASQLSEMSRWGEGVPSGLAWSSDDRLLAIATSLGVYLYDAQGMKRLDMLSTPGWSNSVAFSPDGKFVAAGGWDYAVTIWSVADVNENGCPQDGCPVQAKFENLSSGVVSIAFSDDDARLAAAMSDGKVYVWDIQANNLLYVIGDNQGGASSTAFSPDSKLLVSGDGQGVLHMYNAKDGSLLQKLGSPRDSADLNSLAFSPDGRLLAAASNDKNIYLIKVNPDNTLDEASIKTLIGHDGGVITLAFSPDGGLLASGGWDATLRLWQVSDGKQQESYDEGSGAMGVAFAPGGDDHRLAVITYAGALSTWSPETKQFTESPDGLTAMPLSLALSSDGSNLAVGLLDGGLVAFTLPGINSTWEAYKHDGAVYSLSFAPDGALLASAGADHTIRLWQTNDGALLDTLQFDAEVTNVKFSPVSGALLAASVSGDQGKDVQLWSHAADGWKLLTSLTGHTGNVTCLAFSADGKWLAAGSEDRTVLVWKVDALDSSIAPELLYTLKDHEDRVNRLAFSPDGKWLATVSEDNNLRLWLAADGSLVFKTKFEDAGHTRSLAFSADSGLLAVGGQFGAIGLWSVEKLAAGDGAPVAVLWKAYGGVNELFFLPDGKVIVDSSFDGTIRSLGVNTP